MFSQWYVVTVQNCAACQEPKECLPCDSIAVDFYKVTEAGQWWPRDGAEQEGQEGLE